MPRAQSYPSGRSSNTSRQLALWASHRVSTTRRGRCARCLSSTCATCPPSSSPIRRSSSPTLKTAESRRCAPAHPKRSSRCHSPALLPLLLCILRLTRAALSPTSCAHAHADKHLHLHLHLHLHIQVLICPHGQSPRPLTPLTDLIPLPEDDPARADAPTLYEVVGKPSPTLRHVPKLCGPVAVLQAGDAVFIVDNHKVLKVRLCDSALLSRSAELWRCSGPTDDWHWNGGNPPPERPSTLSDTVLADGKLFVADATRDCVVVLDACSLAWQTNVRVAPPHQSRGSRALAEPTGLCAHGFEIFVACKGSHCVQVLSHSGELVNQIGTKGSKPGEFNEPVGCALLPARGAAAARLIVAEKAGRRLQLLTLGGQPLQVVRLPAIGGAPPSLRGIALTEGREPTLWVTDVTAHALRRFSVHVPCS